jgi:two-component system heavy metal sensor histidine kinase CusS
VLGKDGRVIVETPGMAAILPPGLFPDPIGATKVPTRAQKWQLSEDKFYLLMAAWAAPPNEEAVHNMIQVALDVSHDMELLAEYQQNLAIILFWGILLSSSAGAAITLRGLHPLEAITKTAKRITASQLHERIEPSHWPKELLALAAAFDGMLTRLDRSFICLSQFSMDLAHELRSPVNNLMGETEVALSRHRTEEEYRQVLESNLEECRKLSGMIDSLLFLARAESAQGAIERSRVDAHQEIEGLLDYYDALAEERGIRLSCSGEAVLSADPALFARCMQPVRQCHPVHPLRRPHQCVHTRAARSLSRSQRSGQRRGYTGGAPAPGPIPSSRGHRARSRHRQVHHDAPWWRGVSRERARQRDSGEASLSSLLKRGPHLYPPRVPPQPSSKEV